MSGRPTSIEDGIVYTPEPIPAPMSGRPTSIEGGIRYTPEPIPRERPVTQAYVVTWRIEGGQTRYVTTPPYWRGCPMTPDELDRFRARVERDMATWPPI